MPVKKANKRESIGKKIKRVRADKNVTLERIANRILLPMLNEAVYCLYHGVGTREDIDTVMKLSFKSAGRWRSTPPRF